MPELIKTDLKRIRKDKLLLAAIVVGIVFAVTTPLLYRLIASQVDAELMELVGGDLFTAKTHFFSAFALGNNCGTVVPVLVAIIMCKDFSHGTIRNKVICGHSRSSVFLSMYAACAVALWLVMLLHALLTLGISLVFFDYQTTAFTWVDFWYLMESLLFELLAYLFVAALLTCLSFVTKKAGIAVVLYVAAMFAFTMVASIIQVALMVLEMEGGNESIVRVLEFFQNINVFQSSAMIGTGTAYEWKDVAVHAIPPVVGTAGLLGLGLLASKKKDLK